MPTNEAKDQASSPAVLPEQAAQPGSASAVSTVPSLRQMLALWLPLAASIVMMVLEPSIINIGLGRTVEPELALAAYGVAFSLALVVEAPIIMLIDASVAKSGDRHAFALLQRFALGLGLAVTAIGLILSVTPLYGLVVDKLMHIPPDVAERARPTLQILSFWPLPIGWRRTQQGLLIRARQTVFITAATVVRLVTLAAGLAAGLVLWPDRSAVVAAVAMNLSVIVEAAVVTWAARRLVRSLPSPNAPGASAKPAPGSGPSLSLRELWRFYLPLATTTVVQQIGRPMLNAGIAAVLLGRESLAAWPVVWGLVTLIAGPAWSLQQLANALAVDQAAYRQVRRFAISLGSLFALLLTGVVLTPVYGLVMGRVYNLSPVLQALAQPAAILMIPYPLLLGLQGLLRGTLIRRGCTPSIRSAVLVNLLTLIAALLAGVWLVRPTGVVLAALVTQVALLAEVGWLRWKGRC